MKVLSKPSWHRLMVICDTFEEYYAMKDLLYKLEYELNRGKICKLAIVDDGGKNVFL